ncbi:LysR family transcriptional regulator [Gymnodinialimonas ceratoperidinii]|uniref:LysR family transcriptional regulator n=1 Tax=Gymnodinialimonas ceratoperidinii TaxID=2856823 RepID=A0A8F6TWT1_9RHOB|nr:LysR family transcriptional regulator [Gymnodinialimonas ceratoperidinii]QXT39604.1 LysR family transcriptional regulator [Gymnodinialimonas ceratoperidinii]
MSLSLRAMRYVQAALRHGSITRAADEMHVTPSAIAAALDQTEAAFGMALVTRARAKGISPTTAGRDIGRRIDDLLERYDRLLTDVSDLQSNVTGNLAIGYNAPLAPAFLPFLAAQMLASHPGVTFTLTEGDNDTVQKGLQDGQFDMILFVEELPDPQIETQPLLHAPTYCLCPADHPLAKQEAVTVSQIVGEPLILLDRPAARRYYLDVLQQGGDDVRVVATANSTEMVRSLVASNVGVSLLNMKPGNAPSYAGDNIRCLPISDTTSGVTLSLGFAPGPKRRLIRTFTESCIAACSGPLGDDLTIADA